MSFLASLILYFCFFNIGSSTDVDDEKSLLTTVSRNHSSFWNSLKRLNRNLNPFSKHRKENKINRPCVNKLNDDEFDGNDKHCLVDSTNPSRPSLSNYSHLLNRMRRRSSDMSKCHLQLIAICFSNDPSRGYAAIFRVMFQYYFLSIPVILRGNVASGFIPFIGDDGIPFRFIIKYENISDSSNRNVKWSWYIGEDKIFSTDNFEIYRSSARLLRQLKNSSDVDVSRPSIGFKNALGVWCWNADNDSERYVDLSYRISRSC